MNIFDIPKGETYEATISIDSTGTRTKTTIRNINFIPTPDRLTISPNIDDSGVFKLIGEKSEILCKKLPHTPISSLGHNFSYELEDEERFTLELDFTSSSFSDLYKQIKATPKQESVLAHSLLIEKDPDVVLHVSFHARDGKRTLQLNYHYEIKDDIEKAQKVLGNFYDNYLHSKLANEKLISKEYD